MMINGVIGSTRSGFITKVDRNWAFSARREQRATVTKNVTLSLLVNSLLFSFNKLLQYRHRRRRRRRKPSVGNWSSLAAPAASQQRNKSMIAPRFGHFRCHYDGESGKPVVGLLCYKIRAAGDWWSRRRDVRWTLPPDRPTRQNRVSLT